MSERTREITVPVEASILIFTDESLEAQIYKPKSEVGADGSHTMPGHTVVAAAVAYALKEEPQLLEPIVQALLSHIKSEGGEVVEIGVEDQPHGRLH